ncbi:Glycine betaine transporter OpuD [Halomonas sp. THAF12]|uniref:BCCT family transporter n=1 Tax=Halomonas sp. THAF12 TaxID=2587849 RepID=UPI0012A794F2|nr:BCCT family transporter [Halomonas sp. THAF12]QFT86117.1 Glycine betaine transporter OpuD [Halomonas sp. THAF12]
MKPTITIDRCPEGIYRGLNLPVTLISKLVVAALVVFAVAFPDQAVGVLGSLNAAMLSSFNAYYIYAVGLMLLFCLIVGFGPWGSIRLGAPEDRPEFSRFAWFSMMFGAGMGIGLLFYSIGEPLSHFQQNPALIEEGIAPQSAEAVLSSIRYTFLHWGLHGWAIYTTAGLAMAFFAYRMGLPLTIRSTLSPLFGDRLNGVLGHLIDIIAVVATTLGIATTMGAGVSQLVSGVEFVTGIDSLVGPDGAPGALPLMITLLVVMSLSTLSAVTGVKRGVNWLSQFNMALSMVLLAVFVAFGATGFAFHLMGESLFDYLAALPEMSVEIWPVTSDLGQWQVDWTILQRAWFIAFAPFVGLFLARISRGRTLREFVLGCVVVPSLMCFVWILFLGGTSLQLEVSGVAGGQVIEAVNNNIASVLFVTIDFLNLWGLETAIVIMSVLLIITYLVTSADSGVLVLNTIMAGGDSEPAPRHRVIWGVLMTLVVGSLLLAGGLSAIQKAMLIASLPFSALMLLMCVSMLKALLGGQARHAPA